MERVAQPDRWAELVQHLARTTPLGSELSRRVVEEVVAFFAESVEEFVRRRHRELHGVGRANAEIYQAIAAELATRPVAAPALSTRQIRRIVYG